MKSGATETSYYYLQNLVDFPKNIHVDHIPQNFITSKSKYKILWSHNSYDQPCYQNFDHRICDLIVCPSAWLANQFVRFHNVPPEKLRVIPNGVSDKFKYSNKKQKKLIHTSVPYKGLIHLPKIFALVRQQHPDFTASVFSSMSLYNQPETENYIEAYSELIRMPGIDWYSAVDNDLLVQEYQESALFVHPNIWEETFCVSMLEAQRSGCYPIISDIGALPETSGEIATIVPMKGISTKSGWQVEKQFINSFAQAVIDALNVFDQDRPYYDHISKKCAEHAEKYDWSVIAEQWKKLLKEFK